MKKKKVGTIFKSYKSSTHVMLSRCLFVFFHTQGTKKRAEFKKRKKKIAMENTMTNDDDDDELFLKKEKEKKEEQDDDECDYVLEDDDGDDDDEEETGAMQSELANASLGSAPCRYRAISLVRPGSVIFKSSKTSTEEKMLKRATRKRRAPIDHDMSIIPDTIPDLNKWKSKFLVLVCGFVAISFFLYVFLS